MPTPGAQPVSKKPTVPFAPTERDVEIIRHVWRHRLLRSRSHLVPLFGGSLNVLRRLQKLTRARFLYRLARAPHEEAIYAIGDKGSDLMRDRFGAPRPKVSWTAENKTLTERHVEHTLLISDVLVQIELACRQTPDVRYIDLGEIIERHASARVKQRAQTVGGRPLRWRVELDDGGWRGRTAIEPDGLFGIEHGGETSWFFLEADRATMSVIPERPRLDRASLLKKMLQYWASWQKGPDGENLTSRAFGLPDVRTLFVLSTEARGDIRLERCLEANRHFYGGKGTGLFLFAKVETLLESPDVLRAPLTAGTGKTRSLV